MKRSFVVVVILAIILSFASCNEAPKVAAVATYDSMTVTISEAEVTTKFSASIRGRQDVNIMPQVSGTISKVCVTEGQNVQAGQALFIIDQVPFKAALTTAEANVKAAEASVATAELTLGSKRELFARNVISQYDLSMAENQLLTTEAALAQAEAQRVNAANSLSYTVVKAPASGVVGTIPFRVGALVGPTMPQPLTTVSDNSEMYVYFSMNETQLLNLTRQHGTIEKALEALPKPELMLSDGSMYEEVGRIESISGVIDQTTGSISLRAVFPNSGRLLHSGSSGNVVLRYKQEGMIIPCIATYEVQDKTFVYKPVEGKAVSQMVEVVKYDGQSYIVKSGLQAGDVIITEGVAMLREGAPVELKDKNGAEVAPRVDQPINE